MIFPRPLFFHATGNLRRPLRRAAAQHDCRFGVSVRPRRDLPGRDVRKLQQGSARSIRGLYFRIRSRDVINGCSKSFKISKPILLLPPPFSRRSRMSAGFPDFGNASSIA
jgi:hypothetical protein